MLLSDFTYPARIDTLTVGQRVGIEDFQGRLYDTGTVVKIYGDIRLIRVARVSVGRAIVDSFYISFLRVLPALLEEVYYSNNILSTP